MPHFVAQTSLPIPISHGKGCRLYGTDGREYLDLVAGWCVGSIGWAHPEVRAALEAEARRGTYIPPFLHNDAWEELAALLCKVAPGNLTHVLPVTSGSEAIDMAIKCARAATGKEAILSITDVYHGHTYGAASVGEAQRRITGSVVPHCEQFPMPGRDAESDDVMELLRTRMAKGDVAAFLSEPVWTNAGVFVPPPDFYPRLQDLCREHGALLVMDEVATGFGHCGTLFGSELWNLAPDILCIAKAFTGGYATMGALLTTAEVWKRSRGIPHYSTFAWLGTDLAATAANVRVILREKLWENAKTVGAHFLSLLKPLEDLPTVEEVRGIGLLFAIELSAELRATDVQKRLADAGVLVETVGNALFFTPHLILTKEEAEEGAEKIRKALS